MSSSSDSEGSQSGCSAEDQQAPSASSASSSSDASAGSNSGPGSSCASLSDDDTAVSSTPVCQSGPSSCSDSDSGSGDESKSSSPDSDPGSDSGSCSGAASPGPAVLSKDRIIKVQVQSKEEHWLQHPVFRADCTRCVYYKNQHSWAEQCFYIDKFGRKISWLAETSEGQQKNWSVGCRVCQQGGKGNRLASFR